MTPDNHLDELLGAYAVDAVDELDRQRVEAYLTEHPEHGGQAVAMRQAAAMLAHTGNPAPGGVGSHRNALDGRSRSFRSAVLRRVPRRRLLHAADSSPPCLQQPC